MNKHYVFVYGTLKRGEMNHYWLNMERNGYSRYISDAETVRKLPLIIASKHNIPFLLPTHGIGENVMGEVYEVDDKMLSALDEIEDHPTTYVRLVEKVTLINDDGEPGECMDCHVYFLRKVKTKYLKRDFHKEYTSRGVLGLRHVQRMLKRASNSTATVTSDVQNGQTNPESNS